VSKDYLDDFSDEYLKKELNKITGREIKSYFNGGKYSVRVEDFEDFFNYKYPNSKKCLFRNVVFTKDIDQYKSWVPIDNCIKIVESDCSSAGLSASFVSRHLSKWCNKKSPELLIDIAEWDGVDHIGEALKKVSVTNISHAHFVELFKEWFSLAVQRMANPSIQNRLIVLRGKQGIGKDFAIRALTSGFGIYANEIDFDQHNKTEIFRIVKNLGIGIVPEFDETHRSSISTIKSVITARSVEMRALYKNESEAVPIRTSFISASNFSNILRDTSGNRRFMLFDLSNIEHTFEKVDGGQICAQAFTLASNKYIASPEAQDAMRGVIESETPDNPQELFVEEVKAKLSELSAIRFDQKLRWFQISKDVMSIAQRFGYKQQRVLMALKSAGITKRDTTSTYYEA
jgi:hypothetical protein